MWETIYYYRETSVEIKLKDYHYDIAALKRDHDAIMDAIFERDYDVEKEFSDRKEAEKWLHEHCPKFTFSDRIGTAVPYILVTGAYIDEVNKETDTDGIFPEEEFIGTVAFSDFPPITVTNQENHEIDYDAAVNDMDDEIREKLHARGYDDPQEFFDDYCEAHEEKYGKEFIWNTGFGA